MTHLQARSEVRIPAVNGMLADQAVSGGAFTDEQAFLNRFLDNTQPASTGTSTVTCGPHHTLFFDGDVAERFYVVREGLVCAYRLLGDGRRHIFRFFVPGDIVGLTLDDVHGYAAETLTATKLDGYRAVDLHRRVMDDPDLSRRVLDLAFDELRRAQDQMMLLGRKSAVERVASFLLGMARRTLEGAVVEGDGVNATIRIPMARADIADYLGLTLETVCRAIGNLKRKGLIRLIKDHRIELVDPDVLMEVAGEVDF